MRKSIIGGIILLVSLPVCVVAQDELTLAEAIRIGLKENYDIRIEQREIDIAENNNSVGEAGFLPTVTANLSQNNNLSDNVKTATPFQLQGKVLSSSVTPGVALNWNLFGGMRAHISKNRLEQLQEESEQNADIVVANTLQAIILGYFNTVLEKERLEELTKQLTLSRDRYNYVRIKTELGTAVSSDLLLEETNYLSDSTLYINQELAYRNAMRNLNVLLAHGSIEKKWTLKDSLNFDPIDYRYETLSERLNRDNVDLKKQYIMQSIIKHDLALRRSDRYPTLQLQAGFNDSRSRVDLSRALIPSEEGGRPGPSDPLSAVTDTYFANLTLSFTLFNGRRINRSIKNAIIQEDIGNIQIDRLKNSLSRDLYMALDDYNTRKKLFQISERLTGSAASNLRLADEKFKGGTINSFDYRVVQNNQLSAAYQRLQALYNLIDAHVAIMRLTGGIIETYID